MEEDGALPSFDEMPSFDDMPDASEPQAPAAQAAAPPRFDDIPSFDDMPDQSRQKPQAEGVVGTFGREAAHSVLPAAGGMLGLGAAGAVAGTLGAGPVGTFLGAIGGMILGSMATNVAQEAALDQLGFDDAQQRAANREVNPNAAFAGTMAPAAATMAPVKGAQLALRGAGAVLGAGFEAGQEYLNEGKVNPAHALAAGAIGAALPGANRVGQALIDTGGRAAQKVAGRPGKQANPAAIPAEDEAASSALPNTSRGYAMEQAPPVAAGETTGNPQSAPTRSSRVYPKGEGAEAAPRVDMLTEGDFSPDIAQALQASLKDNAIPPPAEAIPPLPEQPDVALRQGLNPGEQLPIQTGIEQAAAPPPPAAPLKRPRKQKTVVETGLEEAAKAQGEAPPTIGEFTTSKGSTYAIHPDGTTTRNKAARPEHPGDEGPKPKSERTIFLTKDQANALAPPAEGRIMIVDHGDGTVSTASMRDDGKWGISPSQRRIPFATEPSEGLHPLELWSGKTSKKWGNTGYGAYHFGNEITGIKGAEPPKAGTLKELPPDKVPAATPEQNEQAARVQLGEAEPVRSPKFDDIPDHPAAKIKEVADQVNPEPSAAQIEAGNYAKAPVRMHNRLVKIENPEGSIRRSKPDSPVKWEVEMPYDYGDIKGTKGADGDNIDIAVGKGDRHFIIDQKNAETGKFDEHKVFSHFKDVNDAVDHYNRGFSDNKGPDRLQAIKEVSDDELQAWLKKPGKKTKPYSEEVGGAPAAGPSEGVKPLPKVVTAAVNALREKGLTDAADKLVAMDPDKRLMTASQYVNKTGAELARPDRIRGAAPVVEGIKADDGSPITARDKGDAARKSADVATMNAAYEKATANRLELPTTLEEKAAMRAQVEAFMDEIKGVKYKPAVKHAPYLYARAAKKLLTAKNPKDESWQSFVETLQQLKAGGERDVRQGQRIESDIGLSRRAGDEAILTAEQKNAGRNTVEDEMIEALDAKRAGKDEGYIDVPHEEAETMVKPEPVTKENVDKFERKTGKLDLAKPADRMKLQADTAQLAANLVKTAQRKPPIGESEGAASAGRKIAVDDPAREAMIKEIMAASQRAEKRVLGEGAIREEELGKFDAKQPARDKLADFWNNESGALDLKKITESYRNGAKAIHKQFNELLGGLISDRGRRADAVLARVAATHNATLSEHAKKLFDAKYYQWIDDTSSAERIAYIKALENIYSGTPRAQAESILRAAGLPAEKAAWMADEAAFHRHLFDEQFRQDAARNSSAVYRPGYVSHIFADTKVGGLTADQWLVKNVGPTWYQKQRAFNSIGEAMKAGFKLVTDHPHELINLRLKASARSNAIVDGARALNREGLAFPVKDLTGPYEGLDKIWPYKRQLPDGNQWIFAPDAAVLWENSIEAKGLLEHQGNIGSIARGWLAAKSVFVPVTLMLSQFHAFHVVANIMPAQALYNALERSRANGKWGKNFMQAGKDIWNDSVFSVPMSLPFVGNWLHDKPFFNKHVGRRIQDIWQTADADLNPNDLMVKRLFQEGGISPYQPHEDVIGAKPKFAKALKDVVDDPGFKNAGAVALRGFQRGIELLQEPLFKYTIPSLKNAAYLRSVATAFELRPDLVHNDTLRGQVLRELGKDIDDRFGEMFYKGLFWNKAMKDVGIMSFLSMSWNLGQVRQLVGAANQVGRTVGIKALGIDPGTPIQQARETASNKLAFVTAYVGLSMLTAGAITWALTGKPPEEITDYVFPRSGHIDPETGHPHRLSSPFNTREAIMLKAHADEHNSWVGGFMQLVWNKMVLSPLTELWTNRDFFGRALYDTNAPGWKAVLQGIDSTLGRTLSPISISGADRAQQQGLGAKGQALSFLGFGPGPKYVNESQIERRINKLSHEYAPQHKPYEYGPKTGLGRGLVQGTARWALDDETKSDARYKARNEMNLARQKGDTDAELEARRKMVEKGELSPRIVGKMVPGRQFEGAFARLPKEEQLAVAKTMSDQDFQRFVLTNKDIPRANRLALMQFWTQQRSVNR